MNAHEARQRIATLLSTPSTAIRLRKLDREALQVALEHLPECTTDGCNHGNCSEAAIEAEAHEHAAQLEETRKEAYQDE
jgi:hypothetical protein